MLLIVSDPRCLEHRAPPGHPERPERFKAVDRAVRAALPEGLQTRYATAREATREELLRVHDAAYLDELESFCADGGGMLDADTFAGPNSPMAARLAAGAAVLGVEHVLSGAGRCALSLQRPPGHHAGRGYPMGFCLFNNVAVAAAAALDAHGLERVLVIDWDLHHGNGTQDIFYKDPRVFFFSMHRHPFWPGTGAAGERGEGTGQDFTFNIPLAEGTSPKDVRRLFREGLAKVAKRIDPQLVVLSAGFDMHAADPMGGLGLAGADYGQMTHEVAELFLVKKGAMGLVSCLEGGYNLDALGESAAAHATALHAKSCTM
ncbi:MAG: histone deacetylase [Planctomycetes bacterium]|nr:histone deacetylase [Planctomycetota bacterium]